jgi:putative exosortase-associated protein (TIGR04073 family)
MTYSLSCSLRAILLATVLITGLAGVNTATAQNYKSSELERSLVTLFFYPYNRILDFNDIVHFGIAGSLGLGAEIAITEKASFGAYYTAQEKGIAYHGHKANRWSYGPHLFGSPFYGGEHLAMWTREAALFGRNGPNGAMSPWSWFGVDWANSEVLHPVLDPFVSDFPVASSSNWYLLPSAAVKLIPGAGHAQRQHSVENGYATASFGSLRVETSDDDSKHFHRYRARARAEELLRHQFESDADQGLIALLNEQLDGSKESAIRGEVILGLVHPYVAFEIYEALDFLGGTVMLDLKKDDWHPQPGAEKGRKLGRGVNNVVFGLLEIPRNIYAIDEVQGGSAALTVGLARGAWRAFLRTAVVGPYEILTFPTDTDVIIEPEFYFEHGLAETTWRQKR